MSDMEARRLSILHIWDGAIAGGRGSYGNVYKAKRISGTWCIERYTPKEYADDHALETEDCIETLREFIDDMRQRVSFAESFLEDLAE